MHDPDRPTPTAAEPTPPAAEPAGKPVIDFDALLRAAHEAGVRAGLARAEPPPTLSPTPLITDQVWSDFVNAHPGVEPRADEVLVMRARSLQAPRPGDLVPYGLAISRPIGR